jgi:hypothetical protein
MAATIGSKQITADGYLFGAVPTRVFALFVKSDSTGGNVVAKDANTTEYDTIVGAASVVTPRYYPGGLLFPGGCYLDIDNTHTTYVTAIASVEY